MAFQILSARLTIRSSISTAVVRQLACVAAKRARGRLDAGVEQELLPGGLVPGAWSGQFLDVNGLADVVGGRAEENSLAIDDQGRVVNGKPGRELGGDVVHGAQMRGQPRWRVQLDEKGGDLGW
ncbi:hypothetical protein [Micromonospora pallida]|uniref:hypothetical protein n=1 Tax=Micromonospora pallida TaxID=145854 RepID=UPI00159EF597|nr:hypothetical protein [Micromonospora pallida]